MKDNTNIRDERDRSKVAGNEEYELQYLEQKLGVTKEQIVKAIAKVGNNREAVEEYILTHQSEL